MLAVEERTVVLLTVEGVALTVVLTSVGVALESNCPTVEKRNGDH